MTRTTFILAAVLMVLLSGCRGRAELLPNSNPALRKSATEFAADAAKRTFPEGVPQGRVADARAEIDYTFDQVNLINFSGRDWADVEVWANRTYVVHLPVLADRDLQNLGFRMFYNDAGEHFPPTRTPIEELHVVVDGELLAVPSGIAD
jgi:hypothetical protein